MQDFLYDILNETNDSLCHHGILGQKWGVRRYQNSDGSLTDAGRKRYGKYVAKIVKKDPRYSQARDARIGQPALDYMNETDRNRLTDDYSKWANAADRYARKEITEDELTVPWKKYYDDLDVIVPKVISTTDPMYDTAMSSINETIRQNHYRKVTDVYDQNVKAAIESSGWTSDTWSDRMGPMTQLYTAGKLGKYNIDFDTTSGGAEYYQHDTDEALTPDKILRIDATKKQCEKDYKKVLSTIRESVAKQYYDNQPADDSYTLPGMGMTRSGLKDGLVPSRITISTKNPERIRMDIRNSDGGGLADFLVSYDVDKDKVYDIQYTD